MATKVASPKFTKAEADKLYFKAHEAGQKAADKVRCVPMYVVGKERDGTVTHYPPVMDGVCGFASVRVFPGNSSYARYLKQHRGASAAYRGGVQIWISAYGQSYTRKDAYGTAFASVLREAGVEAYCESRID